MRVAPLKVYNVERWFSDVSPHRHAAPLPVALHALTYATAAVATAAVVVTLIAIVLDSQRVLATGLLLMFLAGWVDRSRVARMIATRYARIVALWQEDVAALRHGTDRPDLRLLDVDDETI